MTTENLVSSQLVVTGILQNSSLSHVFAYPYMVIRF